MKRGRKKKKKKELETCEYPRPRDSVSLIKQLKVRKESRNRHKMTQSPEKNA